MVIDAEIAKLGVEAATLLEEIQKECTHPPDEVVEAVFRNSSDIVRICNLCGLEEREQRGGGYNLIKVARARIDQNVFELHRFGFSPGIRFRS